MQRLLAPWELLRLPRAALRRLPAEAWRGAAERFGATVEAALEDPAFTQAWDDLFAPGWLDRPVARLLHGLARAGLAMAMLWRSAPTLAAPPSSWPAAYKPEATAALWPSTRTRAAGPRPAS